MSDAPDILGALRALADRATEELAKLGLTLEHFGVDPRGARPQLHCVFSIDIAELTKDVEQAGYDDAFDRMMREQKAAERDATIEAMRVEAQARSDRKKAELKDRLEAGGPILPMRSDDDA